MKVARTFFLSGRWVPRKYIGKSTYSKDEWEVAPIPRTLSGVAIVRTRRSGSKPRIQAASARVIEQPESKQTCSGADEGLNCTPAVI